MKRTSKNYIFKCEKGSLIIGKEPEIIGEIDPKLLEAITILSIVEMMEGGKTVKQQADFIKNGTGLK